MKRSHCLTEIDGLKMDYEDGEEVEPPLEIPAHLKEICADMLVDEAEELLQKKWHFLGLWGEDMCFYTNRMSHKPVEKRV